MIPTIHKKNNNNLNNNNKTTSATTREFLQLLLCRRLSQTADVNFKPMDKQQKQRCQQQQL